MFRLSYFKHVISAFIVTFLISGTMEKPTRLWPVANDVAYLSYQAAIKLGLIEADFDSQLFELDPKKALDDLLVQYVANVLMRKSNQDTSHNIISLIKYHPELMEQEIRNKRSLLTILSVNSWGPPLSPDFFKPLSDQLFNSGIPFNVNAKDHEGDTPLMDAALMGNISMVKHLLTRGADVNYENKSRKVHKTALHIAVLLEDPVVAREIIQMLLENGANPENLIEPLEGGQTIVQRASPQIQSFVQDYLKAKKNY